MNAPCTPLDDRRKRLLFRSWHRGTRELDLLLGRFAERHLSEFSESEIDLFENILEQGDSDLYDWIAGRAPVPAESRNAVLDLLVNFKSWA